MWLPAASGSKLHCCTLSQLCFSFFCLLCIHSFKKSHSAEWHVVKKKIIRPGISSRPVNQAVTSLLDIGGPVLHIMQLLKAFTTITVHQAARKPRAKAVTCCSLAALLEATASCGCVGHIVTGVVGGSRPAQCHSGGAGGAGGVLDLLGPEPRRTFNK